MKGKKFKIEVARKWLRKKRIVLDLNIYKKATKRLTKNNL
jgi:hypothetical protein